MTSIFLSSLLACCWSSLLCPAQTFCTPVASQICWLLENMNPQSLSVSTQLNIFLKLTCHGFPLCQKVLPTLTCNCLGLNFTEFTKSYFLGYVIAFHSHGTGHLVFCKEWILLHQPWKYIHYHLSSPIKKNNKRYCCFVFYQMACCLPFIENITQLAVLFLLCYSEFKPISFHRNS